MDAETYTLRRIEMATKKDNMVTLTKVAKMVARNRNYIYKLYKDGKVSGEERFSDDLNKNIIYVSVESVEKYLSTSHAGGGNVQGRGFKLWVWVPSMERGQQLADENADCVVAKAPTHVHPELRYLSNGVKAVETVDEEASAIEELLS